VWGGAGGAPAWAVLRSATTGQHGGDGDDCAASGAAAQRAGQQRRERGGSVAAGSAAAGGAGSAVAGEARWPAGRGGGGQLGDVEGGAGKMENEMFSPGRARLNRFTSDGCNTGRRR
jgi:hypothetical protein